jgi:RHS repeat-associated protein
VPLIDDAQNLHNPFGFTGYQTDDISGFYYAQARYYEPNIGRFGSEDIVKGFVKVPITLNQYTYCWNRPITLVDLDGKIPFILNIVQSVAIDAARDVLETVGNTINDALSTAGDWALQTFVEPFAYNEDKERVFNSTLSNYRGQIILRLPGFGTSAVAIGDLMILGRNVRLDANGESWLIDHEHGHYLDYNILGGAKTFF